MELSLEKCIELEISPSEMVILNLLFLKDYPMLEKLMTNTDIFHWSNDDSFLGILQHLELKGYLKITQYGDFKFQDIVLRKKAEDIFQVNQNQKYLTLWMHFPIKVPDGNGGYRVLKAKSTDSDDYKKGLKLWNDIVKKEDGDVVIAALDKQLEVTRSKLQYTQNFLTWLRNRTYQKYVDLDVKPKQDNLDAV